MENATVTEIQLSLPGLPEPKKRGRKPVKGRAMSNAERQKEYRRRLQRAAVETTSDVSCSMAALLKQLSRLSVIPAGITPDSDSENRLTVWACQFAWQEIGRRHGYKTDYYDAELQQLQKQLSSYRAEVTELKKQVSSLKGQLTKARK